MKGSIEPKEKELLDYLYEKANDIADYMHRNEMTVPVAINVQPDYRPKTGDGMVYDYRNVRFSEDYESGNIKRIASLGYNAYADKAEYEDTRYEDKEDE